MKIRAINRATVWRAACLLMIALGANGCGSTGDDHASRARSDSAQVESARGADTVPEERAVAPEVALRTAVEQLLRGDAKRSSGETWFSAATAGALRTVTVDSTGHAIVDFEDLRTLIPNASSSAGSAMLLEELNATVFSVAAVRSVDYLIEGRCEDFYNWLQRGCQTVHRPDAPAGAL